MKATANIATYPPRKESLIEMLESIYDQFDRINICFNYPDTETTEFIDDPEEKIFCNIGWLNKEPDFKDNGKFYFLDTLKEDVYYFTLDDDIIYPADYVEKTIEAIEKYGVIATYHGRKLNGKGLNYYEHHKSHHFLMATIGNFKVDVPGTGVTAFDTRYFHPKGLADCKDQCMSDLIFALEAAKQKKTIGMIEHEDGWLKHIEHEETIYQTESAGEGIIQQQYADQIYDLNYG